MYIRRTKTKTLSENEAYYTYRIVESIRLGKKVKQRTLLNLGNNFSIASEHWFLLCARIEQLLQNEMQTQGELFNLTDELSQTLEAAAQRYYALILNKHAQPIIPDELSDNTTDYHSIDINHVEALQARSIGAETLALHALQQLQLDQKLTALGFNGVDLACRHWINHRTHGFTRE